MSDDMVVFYGSEEDLSALRKTLSEAGFQEHHDNVVRASHDLIPPSIAFIITTGFVTCIKTWLTLRSKRMISRMESKGQKKTIIRGSYSIKKIDRILRIPYSHNIEDDKDDA